MFSGVILPRITTPVLLVDLLLFSKQFPVCGK